MNYNFVIAALGASAGGLKSMTDFFSHIDKKFPVTYVVTAHSPRNHKSLLPDIFRKLAPLPVQETEQGLSIEPNKIYINPPGMKVAIKDGVFLLRSRLETESVNYTINYFFESLAREARQNAIGIIMSGTGSDGTLGLQAIEEYKGTTMVQDPATAQFDGMPLHSIIFDHPDFILDPRQMPAKIYELVESKFNAFIRR